jgi:hypothetical protein
LIVCIPSDAALILAISSLATRTSLNHGQAPCY